MQGSIDVARDLFLDAAHRAVKGEYFTLTLGVNIPFQESVEKPLDIIVARIRLESDGGSYNLANGDRIIATTAQLVPDGESFDISILFELEQGVPRIYVSKEMEGILLERLYGDLDGILDDGEVS